MRGGKKDRYIPLSPILSRGLKAYIEAGKPSIWLFNGSREQEIKGRSGGDFDSRYSQRGVQWAVKQAKKDARISYNSCRNRHCPKCQGKNREKWLAAREAELLPVPYFHVVFTLPAESAGNVSAQGRL